ncbi:MAG: hypothetical protein JXA73_08065 [Acidobacteria bacterium]|nr:hypothetical protein [Acidobacteriota bacterium]
MKYKTIEKPRTPLSDSGIHSCFIRNRRCKSDWAGIGVGDAFKQNLDYSLRMPAQRLFFGACRKTQAAAAIMAGFTVDAGYRFKAKPQLAPCYTTYPATLAAYAAIGLTGFLEFAAAASSKALGSHVTDLMKGPALAPFASVDPKIFRPFQSMVIQVVQTRLILEDLSRAPDMSLIEIYRLFSASQQGFRFESLSEILCAAILYGDILPAWKHQVLHPLTRCLLTDLDDISQPYFERLSTAKLESLLEIGSEWVMEISAGLVKYLPDEREGKGERSEEDKISATDTRDVQRPHKFGRRNVHVSGSLVDPLDGPNPPALFDTTSTAEQAALALVSDLHKSGPENGDSEETGQAQAALEAAMNFATILKQTCSQSRQWEDIRSDHVERSMMFGAFSESLIQGNQTDGHQVQVLLNGDLECSGEIFDRPIELSGDRISCDKLFSESRSIAEALRRNLYPNREQSVETERIHSNGSLDPGRLPMADFSGAVFRRHRTRQKVDRRGAPVLLIACDASASLCARQMRMVKVLTAAWLDSTVKSRVQIMAGLYHSGVIRRGVTGPLVQWIYHPRKTPAIHRREAIRALATLPDAGTGVQADVLSLSFMLNEASKLARGRSIYMILVSDCEWNHSFRERMSGTEEVRSFFKMAKGEHAAKLHTTLVALGAKAETGLEDLVDNIVRVPEDLLDNYPAVAEKIGVYVASCMRERR